MTFIIKSSVIVILLGVAIILLAADFSDLEKTVSENQSTLSVSPNIDISWLLDKTDILRALLNFSSMIILLYGVSQLKQKKTNNYFFKHNRLTENNNCGLYFALLVLLVVGMNYYIFFFFPPTEGWWQTYAYLIDSGMKPYVDFNMAFPPLFIYFTLLINKISDYFIVYRIIGVIQVVLAFIFLSQILKKFYSAKIALTAAFIAVALMMNSHLFIPNDYHTLVNLLTVVSLYCYLNFKTEPHPPTKFVFLALTALSLVSTLLVKQNVGLFLSLAVMAVFMLEDRRHSSSFFLYFIAAYFLAFIGLSQLMGLSPEKFWAITFQNDAKGSVSTLLFNFLLNSVINKYFNLSCALAALYVYIQKQGDQDLPHAFLLGLCPLVLLFLIYQHDSPLITFVILLTLIYIWVEAVNLSNSKLSYDVLLIFASLVYADTLTSEMSINYLYIITAFLISKMLSYCETHFTENYFKAASYSLLLLFTTANLYDKYNVPYAWWGAQSKINYAQHNLPYKAFKYIHVDQPTANFFAAVKNRLVAPD